MKRLIPAILILAVLLIALSITAANAGAPTNFVGNPTICFSEDPNRPGPESGYIGNQFNCIHEPNDPGPESV